MINVGAEKHFYFGLNHEDLVRLKDGKMLQVNLQIMGGPDVEVCIYHAGTVTIFSSVSPLRSKGAVLVSWISTAYAKALLGACI